MRTFGKLDANNLIVDAVVVNDNLKNPSKWLSLRLLGDWIELQKPAGIGYAYDVETKKFSPPPKQEEDSQDKEVS